VWVTPVRRTDPAPDPPFHRIDPVDETGAPLQVPVYYHRGPVEGVPWEDDDGTVYRVVARLNPGDGWVSVETIMRWFTVPYTSVALWVRKGLLDGALEVGSTTKHYRVLDTAKCMAEAGALRTEARSQRARSARARQR